MLPGEVLAQFDAAHRDGDGAEVADRIARVDHQVDDGLLQLGSVRHDRRQVVRHLDHPLDGGAGQPLQQLSQLREHLLQAQHHGAAWLAAAEGKELLGDAGGPPLSTISSLPGRRMGELPEPVPGTVTTITPLGSVRDHDPSWWRRDASGHIFPAVRRPLIVQSGGSPCFVPCAISRPHP